MYSSKSVHKMAGAPFLAGPFTDPNRRANDSDRFKGKQFSVIHPKKGNPSETGVLFSKLSNDKVKPDPYDVGNRYLHRFPLDSRKLGFGTHDAPKKDEFLSAQRSEQHRQNVTGLVACERAAVVAKGSIDEQIERLHGRLEAIDQANPGFMKDARPEDDYAGKVPRNLYDIGRSDEGTTSTLLEDGRDQFYSLKRCKRLGKPRHVQRLAVTSQDYGLRHFNNIRNDKVTLLGPTKSTGGSTFTDSGHLRVGEEDM